MTRDCRDSMSVQTGLKGIEDRKQRKRFHSKPRGQKIELPSRLEKSAASATQDDAAAASAARWDLERNAATAWRDGAWSWALVG